MLVVRFIIFFYLNVVNDTPFFAPVSLRHTQSAPIGQLAQA